MTPDKLPETLHRGGSCSKTPYTALTLRWSNILLTNILTTFAMAVTFVV